MSARTNLVLVTGGTGHLGRELVKKLVVNGRNVRLLATKPGAASDVEWVKGDLASGEGIEESLRGVESVINAATFSPIARRGAVRLSDFFYSPSAVDVGGTQRLLEGAARAGVQHFLHVSVAGLEDTSLPYSRVKLSGESLVRHSSIPWSVVRATPYYYLIANMLAGLRYSPIWPLPSRPWNPIDTSDVADRLVECLDDGRRGLREEIGGPEYLSLSEMACQFCKVTSRRRLIIQIPLSAMMMRRIGFVGAAARYGVKTWSAWLHEHYEKAER
jgi:uncharacterized protein YbjT (DUF2867 family)